MRSNVSQVQSLLSPPLQAPHPQAIRSPLIIISVPTLNCFLCSRLTDTNHCLVCNLPLSTTIRKKSKSISLITRPTMIRPFLTSRPHLTPLSLPHSMLQARYTLSVSQQQTCSASGPLQGAFPLLGPLPHPLLTLRFQFHLLRRLLCSLTNVLIASFSLLSCPCYSSSHWLVLCST